MKRGDIVIVVAQGDYGKPRPAVIIQSDLFNATHASILVCPITSDHLDAPLFRLTLEPTRENGLKHPSQIMVDKILTLRQDRIRKKIGVLDSETIKLLNRALMIFIGLV